MKLNFPIFLTWASKCISCFNLSVTDKLKLAVTLSWATFLSMFFLFARNPSEDDANANSPLISIWGDYTGTET